MASTILEFTHLKIPLEDLVEATNNFADENIIGKGDFGNVYKGKLKRSNGWVEISARRLDRRLGQGDVEFWTEISVLSNLHHHHIVSLIGFCDEKGEKIIVNPHYAKGSLDQYLSDPRRLSWMQRLHIAMSICYAIKYIHYELGQSYYIIHRNINSLTILLDEYWYPRLSGFEFSIQHPVDRMNQVLHSDLHIGKTGYMDPAIKKDGGVTHKSDIYSFGVVLFELLCGRKANEDNKLLLAPLAKSCYEDGKLHELIHTDLWFQMGPQSFWWFANAAYFCLENDRTLRIDIDKVMFLLGTAFSSWSAYATYERDRLASLVPEKESCLPSKIVRSKSLGQATSVPLGIGSHFANQVKSLEYLRIELKDIEFATDHFSERFEISHDKFGVYYKAELECFDRKNPPHKRRYTVKIKRMHYRSEDVFNTEMEILSSCKHRNIESLVGFCDEGKDMILVYEYVSSTYLSGYLGSHMLTWEKRVKICIDVAHGLSYLHNETGDKKIIIHRDINCKSIVYDNYNSTATIVGFGLSVSLPSNQDEDTLRLNDVTVTEHYLDPEYAKTGKLKRESDVFSFGVLMFEILCGRSVNEIMLREGSEYKGITQLVQGWLDDGIIDRMVAPILKGVCVENRWLNKDSLDTFIKIAYECLAENQNERPTMKFVVKELEKALSFLVKSLEHLRIGLEDIKLATNNFTRCSETSVSHSLYLAELTCFDREYPYSIEGKNKNELPKRNYQVKIKLIHNKEYRFHTEIEVLSRCKHCNIESLLGFCDEGDYMILVYEFLPTTLEKSLKEQSLTWEKRLKICLYIAHGLNYLHNEMEDQKRVIHGNINCYHILLDHNWEAKIGNFEQSVFLPRNHVGDAIHMAKVNDNGSRTDPEYFMTGNLKRESDIYSFGVVMFEILCGLPVPFLASIWGHYTSLGQLLREWIDNGVIQKKISPIVKGENGGNKFFLPKGPNKDSLGTFINIGYQCLADKQDHRPTMEVVIKELERALWFQENHKDTFRMSLEDIKVATQNFGDDIGGGGFGRVYKGELALGQSRYPIVAKLLDTRHGQGEKQYYNELQILYEYKHENVIGLVGYSNETDKKIIVYEHASKGSLDKYLHNASLTWRNRLKICIDFATGLDFLHGGGNGREVVIHRDIKAANILLFDDWKAKIGDFGLSIISAIDNETDHVIDHACGTKGYLDPLYLRSGFLTIESDIYSFGVVLFEILYGKSTHAIHKQKGQYLPSFIKHMFEEGKQDEVVFQAIKNEIVEKSLATFRNIAYQCLHEDRGKRPTANEVLVRLKKSLEFQENYLDTFRMSVADVILATQNFSHDIGGGGFGRVYRGEVAVGPSNEHYPLVVKRLETSHGQAEQQYYNELQILYEYRHENVIRLVGYCDEKDEKIIVYEHASKGSLDNYLHDASLTWSNRLKISIDFATGLDFLHGGAYGQEVVIHGDIKAANILLFDDWKAKVGDFGHSIISTTDKETDYVIDRACGTEGYLDPLFLKSGFLTIESDIYSFGVVLFEILCGRSTYAIHSEKGQYLPSFIKQMSRQGKQDEVVFQAMKKDIEPKSLTTFRNIAHKCLREDRKKRPTANEILVQLKKSLHYQVEGKA